MRSAGNFNPEWGYLAPAPSFMRTARIVLVATAIGATAGAAVVLSLVERPVADETHTASVAAHAIVTAVQAAPAAASASTTASTVIAPVAASTPTATPIAMPAQPSAPAIAHIATQSAVAPPQPASAIAAVQSAPASDGKSIEIPKTASSVTAVSEATPAADVAPAAAPDTAMAGPEPPPKKTKHPGAKAQQAGIGTVLRKLFGSHTASTSYYPSH